MISLQTNVESLAAQQNLSLNNEFLRKTILQLASGYRINSSSDDAAGLAIANQFRSDVAELTQGVRNANDGASQLQIADRGLSAISQILDRMKTLATQSASDTFTGDRATLDNEYQALIGEITRQASNIGLNSGGVLNTDLSVYLGGGRASGQAGSSLVDVDLSGPANAVDAVSLGLRGTEVIAGGGSSFTGNNVSNLNSSSALFNVGASGAQTFAVSYVDGSDDVATANISITGTSGGVSGADFVIAVNTALQTAGLTGISSQIGTDGDLQFSGANLLSVAAGTSGTAPTSLAVQSGATLLNGAHYQSTGTLAPFVAGDGGATEETLDLTVGGNTVTISLDSSASGTTSATSAANLVASLNAQLKGHGVYATSVGNSVTLQSASAFTLAETGNTPGPSGGTPGTGSAFGTTAGPVTVTHTSYYKASGAFTPFTGSTAEHLTLRTNGTDYHISLLSGR
jgi:flagellin